MEHISWKNTRFASNNCHEATKGVVYIFGDEGYFSYVFFAATSCAHEYVPCIKMLLRFYNNIFGHEFNILKVENIQI